MTTIEAQNFLNSQIASLSDEQKETYEANGVTVPEIGTMTANFGTILGYMVEKNELKYQVSERPDKAIGHLRIVSSISHIKK